MIDKIGIFWFRQDLRLSDNMALNELIIKCDKIIPIYIYDDIQSIGDASKWWLHNSLKDLDISLNKKNSKLFFFKGSPKDILIKLIKTNNIAYINWSRLYDEYSINRDTKIKNQLKKYKVKLTSFNGSLINEPWTIKNKSGSFFKVFTPYWKNCLEQTKPIKIINPPKVIHTHSLKKSEYLKLSDYNLYTKGSEWTETLSSHWKPGEIQALEKLKYFKNNIIDKYSEGRDRPDKDYTSKLSPHLHFGEISPARIFLEVEKKNVSNFKSKQKYLAEIGWREFSHNLLYHFPKIRTEPIQTKFKKFQWNKNIKYFRSWKLGKTGYPIIDAGMRQLYETGWMHNRLRMIVGSFLCKNLLIHWVEGEKWFYDTLVDADLASNSSGWQWIAGCGADAAPYFRIFNPVTQGLKFDPNGEYVSKYVPEIRKIPINLIHTPWLLNEEQQKDYECILGRDYPKPIVMLSESREKALTAFSHIKNSNE